MELFLIFGIAAISSIVIGYLGVEIESGFKQAKRNPLIEKSVSTILLFPVIDKLVEFTDSKVDQVLQWSNQARDRFCRYVKVAKYATYTLLSLTFLLLIIRVPPFLILGIFGCIIFFILKSYYSEK